MEKILEITLDTYAHRAHTTPMFNRQPANKNASALGIRFRSKAEVAKIKRAAKYEGMTFNTFVAAAASKLAEEILASINRPNVAGQPGDEVSQAQYS